MRLRAYRPHLPEQRRVAQTQQVDRLLGWNIELEGRARRGRSHPARRRELHPARPPGVGRASPRRLPLAPVRARAGVGRRRSAGRWASRR